MVSTEKGGDACGCLAVGSEIGQGLLDCGVCNLGMTSVVRLK